MPYTIRQYREDIIELYALEGRGSLMTALEGGDLNLDDDCRAEYLVVNCIEQHIDLDRVDLRRLTLGMKYQRFDEDTSVVIEHADDGWRHYLRYRRSIVRRGLGRSRVRSR